MSAWSKASNYHLPVQTSEPARYYQPALLTIPFAEFQKPRCRTLLIYSMHCLTLLIYCSVKKNPDGA